MDNYSGHATANVATKMSKHLSKAVHDGGQYSAVAPCPFDSYDVSKSHFPNLKGKKRRWEGTVGSADLQDGSSLFPTFGCLSNSCVTLSSDKAFDDESSINLGLGINPHLIDKRTGKMSTFCGTSKAPILERPKLDLQLSLSTGAFGSAITTFTEGSVHFRGVVSEPVTGATIQLVDEGSTSSRWKAGPFLPPLHGTETITVVRIDPGHNNPSSVIPGLTSNITVSQKSSFACASGATPQKQRNSRVKPCQFSGCLKGSRGASGFCIGHGGGKRCQKGGCNKGAEGKTIFCKSHGGGRRCQYTGCLRSANGRTEFCIGHGGGRQCSHSGGCTTAARGKSGKCIKHGGGKRCKIENCLRSAEGIASLCIAHGGGRRCQYPDCKKGSQGRTMLCKAHGGGKRCTFSGCSRGAEGATPFCKGHGGGKRCTFEGGCTTSAHGDTLLCVKHGGGKRCAIAECTTSARGRTNFCVRHGGGKRCKYEGCDKSAQGRTDFCKGHGGGKRCLWGKSGLGGQAIHVNVDSGLYPARNGLQGSMFEKMKGIYDSENTQVDAVTTTRIEGTSGQKFSPMQILQSDICVVEDSSLPQLSLPEGRVHGGSLMSMLRGNTSTGQSNNDKKVGSSL